MAKPCVVPHRDFDKVDFANIVFSTLQKRYGWLAINVWIGYIKITRRSG